MENEFGISEKFPAKGSIRNGRWCSGNLKASVQDTVTSNLKVTKQDAKVLIVSSERRGESPERAGYNEIEKHRTNAEKRRTGLCMYGEP